MAEQRQEDLEDTVSSASQSKHGNICFLNSHHTTYYQHLPCRFKLEALCLCHQPDTDHRALIPSFMRQFPEQQSLNNISQNSFHTFHGLFWKADCIHMNLDCIVWFTTGAAEPALNCNQDLVHIHHTLMWCSQKAVQKLTTANSGEQTE